MQNKVYKSVVMHYIYINVLCTLTSQSLCKTKTCLIHLQSSEHNRKLARNRELKVCLTIAQCRALYVGGRGVEQIQGPEYPVNWGTSRCWLGVCSYCGTLSFYTRCKCCLEWDSSCCRDRVGPTLPSRRDLPWKHQGSSILSIEQLLGLCLWFFVLLFGV